MSKIYAALAKIQRELKAPKNLWNKFGQYYYRNAEGILEAVKPMLGDMALIISDEPVMIGERFYIKATVTLTDGEESVSAVAYAREDETKKGMDGCQITGACSSYARKYALNALLMIDDSKDSDDDSLSPKNPENDPKNQQVQSANVRPQNAAQHASVTKADTMPAPQPQAAKPAENAAAKIAKGPEPAAYETPGAYIRRRIAEITPFMMDGFNFVNARKSLIASGAIADIPSAVMTMDQARDLIAAIDKNFRKPEE